MQNADSAAPAPPHPEQGMAAAVCRTREDQQSLADTWAKMVKEDGWNLWLGPVAPTCGPDLAWLINDQVAGRLM